MASNFLKDARQISSKVVFEPNDGNLGEIYSVFVQNSNANNLYIENYGLPIDNTGNITLYKKDDYDSGITTYNRTKKIGYFDNENTSIQLNKYRLASTYSNGQYNIAYSSRYITDSQGYVVNPETGKRQGVVFTINLLDMPTKIRFFEIVGSQSLGEYPTEFEFYFNQPLSGYLNSSRYIVKNNTSNPCIVDFGSYLSVDRVLTLKITRWSKPYSSVKIDYFGIKTIFDVSNDDLLLKYNFDNATKQDQNLNYGCKYNTAHLEMYYPSKSYGKLIREKYKIVETDGEPITERISLGKILNVVDLLSELEAYNTKMSIYVKTEFDIRYKYIGKFYISKVKFNTQSMVTNIECEDIVSILQKISFSAFVFDPEKTSISLYDIYLQIRNMLLQDYGINIGIFDNKTAMYMTDIIIEYPKYNSSTVWEFLDKISILGQLSIVSDIYNEENDIIILSEV